MTTPTSALRLVSLVPSLTETLCELGLQSQVVGCTQFCVHPKTLRHTAEPVGGTKDPSIEKIIALKPTHVLVNLEENTASAITELKELAPLQGWEVVETFIETPEQAIQMVVDLAARFKTDAEILASWQNKIQRAQEKLSMQKIQTTSNEGLLRNEQGYIYFIWRDPWMVAGNQTYIAKLLALGGYRNIVHTTNHPKERYPMLTAEHLLKEKPQKLFFSSEPFPFKKRHIEEFYVWAEQAGMADVRTREVRFVDGRALSWWGWGTLAGLEELLHF